MSTKREEAASPEGLATAWASGSPEVARDSAVSHLEAFVALTTKGFLLVAAIAVGVVVQGGELSILGEKVPANQAATLVYVFFIAIFLAIGIHALNVRWVVIGRSLGRVTVDKPALQWSGFYSTAVVGAAALVVGGLRLRRQRRLGKGPRGRRARKS